MTIERLQLENFTAFDSLDMQFSPGVNLLVGQNGTGKTHILKILYTVAASLYEGAQISDKIAGVFLPRDGNIGRLVRRRKGRSRADVRITKDGSLFSLSFANRPGKVLKWTNRRDKTGTAKPVYIPVKEMLANAPGFVALYKNRHIHFEEVYADLIHHAFLPPLRGPVSGERKKLLEMIQGIIGGRVISKNEQFFLKNRHGELEFTLLAEGMRKLGLLWILIRNSTLPEAVALFWDEPEANLNPSMTETLVRILLQLQRDGVQMFIASHNYVLLRTFDIQKTPGDNVRFLSLSHDSETGRIGYSEGENYHDIVPNDISSAYTYIYDEEVRRSIGELQE